MLKKIRPSHLIRGEKGEKTAVRFLKKQGLKIIDCNVSYRIGEIDIIAQDDRTLVFVEVRLRKAGATVSAAESITPAKQNKWKKASQMYLQEHYANTWPDCRFDAILIQTQGSDYEIEWLKGVLF